MNKKTILKMLEEQANLWNSLYKGSETKDAGLVTSVLNDLIFAVKTGNPIQDGDIAGSIACYASDEVKKARK